MASLESLPETPAAQVLAGMFQRLPDCVNLHPLLGTLFTQRLHGKNQKSCEWLDAVYGGKSRSNGAVNRRACHLATSLSRLVLTGSVEFIAVMIF